MKQTDEIIFSEFTSVSYARNPNSYLESLRQELPTVFERNVIRSIYTVLLSTVENTQLEQTRKYKKKSIQVTSKAKYKSIYLAMTGKIEEGRHSGRSRLRWMMVTLNTCLT